MSGALVVHTCGPAVSVQDLGRSGTIALGLTRGGAMDQRALFEGAALLNRPVASAIEMIGFGGVFEATEDIRIAMTGATMTSDIDGVPIAWNASHILKSGARLSIGGATRGAIGYLHVGAGFCVPSVMGSQSAHLAAKIGTILNPGFKLPLKPDPGNRTGWYLPPPDRLTRDTIRITRSIQTNIFGDSTLLRFTDTSFVRDARANRQGIRLNPTGPGFATEGGLTVVSEIIAPGDIQITGDGAPYVLMRESQTTGGYPRIATVIPSDMDVVAQAPLGAELAFELVELDDAISIEQRARAEVKTLPTLCQPLVRDPAHMQDLLTQTLISGVINAQDDPFAGDQR